MMTDNMKLWDAVSKTNPANTKHVNQRGGFTAINANSQIMEATRQFGPIGIGWGYINGDPIFHETLVIVPVTFWHGDRANTFGPVYGCEEWKSDKGRIDSDAAKKAGTDGLTKCLSQLGFNADVFMGLYDDQKYVAQVKAEFAGNGASNGAAPPRDDPKLPLDVLSLFEDVDSRDTLPALTTLWETEGKAAFEKHGQIVADRFNRRKGAIQTMDTVRA